MKSSEEDLLQSFLDEVLGYRESLRLALEKILGDRETPNVLKRLEALERNCYPFLSHKFLLG